MKEGWRDWEGAGETEKGQGLRKGRDANQDRDGGGKASDGLRHGGRKSRDGEQDRRV